MLQKFDTSSKKCLWNKKSDRSNKNFLYVTQVTKNVRKQNLFQIEQNSMLQKEQKMFADENCEKR